MVLRLDANQAWTLAEAQRFCSAFAGERSERVEGVDYIEEPLSDPRLLAHFWETSGKNLPYALDESLAAGRTSFTDEASNRPCVLPPFSTHW